MTGGLVVILGGTGVNFAAGMTGGIAYVLDEMNDFDLSCNMATVDLENIKEGGDDEKMLLSIINAHHENTGSRKAAVILAEWPKYRDMFVKVMPVEYRRAMNKS